MTSISIFNLDNCNLKTKQEKLLSCTYNRKRTKKYVSLLIEWLLKKTCSDFSELNNFFLHNLERYNFLRRCEYMQRKTPSKRILEFLKHFSSGSIHKLFCLTTKDYASDVSIVVLFVTCYDWTDRKFFRQLIET